MWNENTLSASLQGAKFMETLTVLVWSEMSLGMDLSADRWLCLLKKASEVKLWKIILAPLDSIVVGNCFVFPLVAESYLMKI